MIFWQIKGWEAVRERKPHTHGERERCGENERGSGLFNFSIKRSAGLALERRMDGNKEER